MLRHGFEQMLPVLESTHLNLPSIERCESCLESTKLSRCIRCGTFEHQTSNWDRHVCDRLDVVVGPNCDSTCWYDREFPENSDGRSARECELDDRQWPLSMQWNSCRVRSRRNDAWSLPILRYRSLESGPMWQGNVLFPRSMLRHYQHQPRVERERWHRVVSVDAIWTVPIIPCNDVRSTEDVVARRARLVSRVLMFADCSVWIHRLSCGNYRVDLECLCVSSREFGQTIHRDQYLRWTRVSACLTSMYRYRQHRRRIDSIRAFGPELVHDLRKSRLSCPISVSTCPSDRWSFSKRNGSVSPWLRPDWSDLPIDRIERPYQFRLVCVCSGDYRSSSHHDPCLEKSSLVVSRRSTVQHRRYRNRTLPRLSLVPVNRVGYERDRWDLRRLSAGYGCELRFLRTLPVDIHRCSLQDWDTRRHR